VRGRCFVLAGDLLNRVGATTKELAEGRLLGLLDGNIGRSGCEPGTQRNELPHLYTLHSRELGSQLVCKAHKKFEGSTVGEKHNTGEHLIREVFPDCLLFFSEPLGWTTQGTITLWFVGTSVSRVGYETSPGVHDGCRCTVASHVIT
jgi:hypothetical protein